MRYCAVVTGHSEQVYTLVFKKPEQRQRDICVIAL